MTKVLEALERIETTFILNKQNRPSVYNDYTSSVEPYYRDYDLVEKAIKALKIIIDEYNLKADFDCSYEEFLDRFGYFEEEYPKAKFELLKEVFENDKG